MDWTDTDVLGPTPEIPGLPTPPEPTRKARAPTDDGGSLVGVLMGRPPGPMLLLIEYKPLGLETGEGPDPRAPTLEEVMDAVRHFSPEGATWGLLLDILALGPDVPHMPGTRVWLRQTGALKGTDAASGLITPPRPQLTVQPGDLP